MTRADFPPDFSSSIIPPHMSHHPDFGRLLAGATDVLAAARNELLSMPVDYDTTGRAPAPSAYALRETTLAGSTTIQGPGTFLGRETRTLTFDPCEDEGWWFDRTDRPEDLPMRVTVRNVWTTGAAVSNIVLRAGDPSNYVRMVEHIIALRLGLGLDRVVVRVDSGDPPLFNRGSLDLVEAIEQARIVETPHPARWVTVKEPVCAVTPHGALLALLPCEGPAPRLRLDVGIDFKTAIGKQRIRFDMDYAQFRNACVARTNSSAGKMLFCKTIGRVFADIRNLGYTKENLLIAGRHRYHNAPRLEHEGKALEAVWHRAALDLLAALALIEGGRFVGDVYSFKAGHRLDVKLVTLCTLNKIFTPFEPKGA